MARCNKCGSGFIRDAPRGRRSILRALKIYRHAPGGHHAVSSDQAGKGTSVAR